MKNILCVILTSAILVSSCYKREKPPLSCTISGSGTHKWHGSIRKTAETYDPILAKSGWQEFEHTAEDSIIAVEVFDSSIKFGDVELRLMGANPITHSVTYEYVKNITGLIISHHLYYSCSRDSFSYKYYQYYHRRDTVEYTHIDLNSL